MSRKLANWLQGYRDFTSGTESPPIFHLWIALGTLAGAAQRKISMNAGYFRVHTNMYIVLVSPPGRSRKSTALRIGKGLLKSLREVGVEVNFSTQASSTAALVQQFVSIKNKNHQSLTAYSSELGSLLGSKPTEVIDFLVDIYDAEPDWDKQTVGRGLEKITFPWLNLMAATTPQWMGDNLSKTAVEGGYVSRSLFIFDNTRLRVAFPELSAEQLELRKALVADLAHISKLEGEFVFSPEAKEYYKDWYENKALVDERVDYRVSGYYERRHIHVLKTAMALSLAANDTLELDVRDIETAIALLGQIEPGMKGAFSAVGNNPYGNVMQRIVGQIKQHGSLTYKQILASAVNDASKPIIDELLDSLMQMGEIEQVMDGGARRYRHVKIDEEPEPPI